ncbi:hypothetical protein pb186bvf_019140 [Paramecium bursaria]
MKQLVKYFQFIVHQEDQSEQARQNLCSINNFHPKELYDYLQKSNLSSSSDYQGQLFLSHKSFLSRILPKRNHQLRNDVLNRQLDNAFSSIQYNVLKKYWLIKDIQRQVFPLVDSFKELDTQNQGFLTYKKFIAYELSNDQVDTLFMLMDKTKDEKINQEEFNKLFLKNSEQDTLDQSFIREDEKLIESTIQMDAPSFRDSNIAQSQEEIRIISKFEDMERQETQQSFYKTNSSISQSSFTVKNIIFKHHEQNCLVRLLKDIILFSRQVQDIKISLVLQKDVSLESLLEMFGRQLDLSNFHGITTQLGIQYDQKLDQIFDHFDQGYKGYLDEDDLYMLLLPQTSDFNLLLQNREQQQLSQQTIQIIRKLLMQYLRFFEDIHRSINYNKFNTLQAFYFLSQGDHIIKPDHIKYFLNMQHVKITKLELQLIMDYFGQNISLENFQILL